MAEQPGHRCRPYVGKRVVDLGLLALLAVPGILVSGICALVVGLISGRPVIFRQERVGMGGTPFEVMKFRTMLAGPNSILPDQDRVTRVGRLLRRTSLDEVPQLLNVLRGEMSIVGPRPTLQYQVERYDDRQSHRQDVRPGLTGLAQVGGRNSIPWAERIELDLRYVAEQSLWLDLTILARTVWAVLSSGSAGHPSDDPLARPEGQGR